MTHQHRVSFGSLGVLFATVGSAVGLGNIWRFPYIVSENGGGAFLLIYLLCVLLLGLPVMLAEFFIGRHARRNVAGAFRLLAPKSPWNIIGYTSVLVAFAILGFYIVVSGWTVEYLYQAVSGTFEGKTAEQYGNDFKHFIATPVRPIFWAAFVLLLSHLIIMSGVKRGIERSAKIMMPMLFLILIILCIRSVTLPNGLAGLIFLFHPDFSKIGSSAILSAMGQAFFSLSIGMGALITYSSYFSKNTNLQATALQVTLLDTFVALLAAVMIFPAVSSFNVPVGEGTGLAFVTLPNIFQSLPGSIFWASLFFMLLLLAALTSVISLHEVAVAYVHEEFNISRRRAALYVSLIVLVLTIFSSLSFGLLSGYTFHGMTFFQTLDFMTAKILMPLGGMLICLFVGWRIDRNLLQAELTNEGTTPFHFFRTYLFFLRYLAPLAIAAIFLNELGAFHYLKNRLAPPASQPPGIDHPLPHESPMFPAENTTPIAANRYHDAEFTPEETRIILHRGTELPGTGLLLHNKEPGTYVCRRCDAPLYRSDDKFDSHCGWPSFDDEIPGAVEKRPDPDGRRTEIVCTHCSGHLGHVFVGEKMTSKDTRHCVNSASLRFLPNVALDTAYFAAGCFWGVEYHFQREPGVVTTEVGYMGGLKKHPTYKEVCTDTTGHAETLRVVYDMKKTSFDALLKLFFETHDFTQVNRQGPDIGTQYRSAIFYTSAAQKQVAEAMKARLDAVAAEHGRDKTATTIAPAPRFWSAEEYHQRYIEKNDKASVCHPRRNLPELDDPAP